MITSRLGRPFLTVWAGQSLSAIGSMVSGVGVAIFVFVETGDAAWLGVLAALASVPYVLATPLLPLTDRVPRRTMMIAADTFAVVGPATALVLAHTGGLEIWHLAVAGFLGGLGTAFQFPASQAAVPALVDSDVLDRANGLNQLGPAIGVVIGPVLATPMVAWWGIEAVLIVDVATFVVAVVATLMVPFDDVVDETSVDDDGTWRSLRAWLVGDGRPFVTLLAVMAVVNFLLAFFNVSFIVIVTELGGVARAGVALGAGGAAMIVGSLISAKRGVGADRIGTFARGLLLAGAGFVVAALFESFLVVIVGVVIALGTVPAVNAAVSTVYHERVPPSMYGRMFGLRASLGRALEPLGAVSAGFLIAGIAEPAMAADGRLASTMGAVFGTGEGRGAGLVLGGVGAILAVSGIWLGASRLRQVFLAQVSTGAADATAAVAPSRVPSP
ncbi:MFS transporter [Ilumatobacter sp.]|uniref:MFS transporter n=1 Tax=Ilumatobacter sp. TaxID=1967498 RepID=UPI003AF4DC4D